MICPKIIGICLNLWHSSHGSPTRTSLTPFLGPGCPPFRSRYYTLMGDNNQKSEKQFASPLAQERASAGFSVRSLSHLLYGGKETFEKRLGNYILIHKPALNVTIRIFFAVSDLYFDCRQKLHSQIESDPIFRRDDVFFLNHAELYRRSLAKGNHFIKR